MKDERSHIHAPRREYLSPPLRREDLHPDPVEQFLGWMSDAQAADVPEPNAMVLATADPAGYPEARVVLLKGCSRDGFVFFTNYASRKGETLSRNPRGALVFYWRELNRQVRVEGTVVRVEQEVSEKYFASRPRGAQLGAVVSMQSRSVASREVLERKLDEAVDRFQNREVEMPAEWGGYRVVPTAMEFWQGRPDRLHDRFRYTLEGGRWKIERLYP